MVEVKRWKAIGRGSRRILAGFMEIAKYPRGPGMIANRILRTWTLLRVILLGLYGLLWVSGRDDNPQGVWPSPK